MEEKTHQTTTPPPITLTLNTLEIHSTSHSDEHQEDQEAPTALGDLEGLEDLTTLTDMYPPLISSPSNPEQT